MHNLEAQTNRTSIVVERDWIADSYVVTRALSDPYGVVLATVRTEYPCALFDARDVEELVSAL